MPLKLKNLVFGLVLLVLTKPVSALSFTDHKLVGQAKFSVLFWDIYHSELWTKTGKFSELEQDCLLVINYLRDIETEELIARTVEQWQHLKIAPQIYQPFLPKLTKLWPNIAAGDALAMQVVDGQTTFFFNGRRLGEIKDVDFAPLFLAIWLDKNTSQPKLRAQLLGEKS